MLLLLLCSCYLIIGVVDCVDVAVVADLIMPTYMIKTMVMMLLSLLMMLMW